MYVCMYVWYVCMVCMYVCMHVCKIFSLASVVINIACLLHHHVNSTKYTQQIMPPHSDASLSHSSSSDIHEAYEHDGDPSHDQHQQSTLRVTRSCGSQGSPLLRVTMSTRYLSLAACTALIITVALLLWTQTQATLPQQVDVQDPRTVPKMCLYVELRKKF